MNLQSVGGSKRDAMQTSKRWVNKMLNMRPLRLSLYS